MKKIFSESIKVKEKTLSDNLEAIVQAVKVITDSLKKNNKIIIFGNGGSAADSQHIAAEFIGRFQKERKALAAIALTTDTSILTALGNDYNFDIVFARQIEGLGQKGDVAIGLSTSGNSANVIKAVEKAKAMGIKTISLTGCKGGKLAPLTDIKLIVPSDITARIQESHICMFHAICELVEKNFA
ncbi:MAG: phosphoheptose isomerase [Omnitrophica WOR_2 bacterium GWA2_47_8]|nr:MAG: phosphoheptose isomerase [Omnitrophica WOR_2 bacterium GWA2_47_8]